MIRLQKIAVKQGRRTLDEAIRAIDAGHAEMLDVACTDHGMVTIRMRLLAGSTLRAKK